MRADELRAYAERIGYAGPLVPRVAVLREISWLHQLAIPFENLDIALLKRPIVLTPEAILEKLVRQSRGGFCFEQNGLLATVLEALGFAVTMGYATWMPEAGERIVPFDHLVLKVVAPEDGSEWLADVGFGRETPAGPLPLAEGELAADGRSGIAYRIERLDDPDLQWSIARRSALDTDWVMHYDLDLRARSMVDYEERSQFHQTSADSHFTQGVICSKLVPGGRVSVTSESLILTRDGEREETALEGPAALLGALEEWFGIRLDLKSGSASGVESPG